MNHIALLYFSHFNQAMVTTFISKKVDWLHAFILKSAFPQIYSVEFEQKKHSIIRWILGVIILIRYSQVVNAAQYLPVYEDRVLGGIGVLIVGFFYMTGVLLPLMTFLLMFAITYFEEQFQVYTLGTNILSTFLFVTAFAGSGRYYSVDHFLLKTKNAIGKPVKALYNFIGNPDKDQLRILYFFGFLSYAVVSLCALSYHLLDENWMSGLTPYYFFPGAYLSKYYFFFREIQAASPEFFKAFSIFSIFGQSLFQFFMIPLMWFRWGRVFVVLWGFGFFIASLFLINLSYLPHVEVLSWLVYFTRVRKNEPFILLFDDRCNFCRRSVSTLRFLNFNGLLEFVPISASRDLLQKHSLNETDVKVWMYGIRGNEILKGFDLYYKVVFRNPLLWLLIPFFIAGKYTGLGYKIYAGIAKNRYKIFGTCELSYPEPKPSAPGVLKAYLLRASTIVLLTLYVTYLSFQLPIVGNQVRYYVGRVHLGFVLPVADYAITWGGFVTPIVFNASDLKLNERFFNLFRITAEGEQLVQFINEEGARLDYITGTDYLFLSNHGSDLLYYALIMRFERNLTGKQVDDFLSAENYGGGIVRNLMEFDKRYIEKNDKSLFNQFKGYKLIIYENRCISSLEPDRFENKVIFEKEYPK